MNEKLIETLIDKLNTNIDDSAEVNLIVRRLHDLRQPLDRINERVDAIQASQKGIEDDIKIIKEEFKTSRKDIEFVKTMYQTTQEEIKKIPDLLSIRKDAFDELKMELRETRLQLTLPQQHVVKHHHHLSWPLVIALVLFATNCLFIAILINAHNQLENEKENDFKYRYLKTLNSQSRGLTDTIDTIYLSDPKMFKKTIEEKERKQSSGH